MSLLDKASLIVTPNAYKTSKLYSVVPNTTLGDMDVVRATTATRVNSAGLIEVVPRNLLTYSEQFENVNWSKQAGSSIFQNTTIAPNGTLTADTLNILPGQYFFQNISAIASTTYRISIYVKVVSGTKQFKFNIYSGTGNDFTSSVFTATTEWQRFTYSFTAISNATTGIYPILVDGLAGGSFFIWGAQVENFATAIEYFPTTTRLNIPRIDYTNGSCPSILVEPQRTNLNSTSNLSGWGATPTVTRTLNTTDLLSPDGSNNATKLVSTLITGDISNVISVANGAVAFSFYGRVLSGSQTIQVSVRNNSGTIVSLFPTLTTQWQRFTIINSNISVGSSGAVWFYPNSISTIYIYGAQMEQGSYPTSYIPTVASTVTRNADVISKTGISSLIGQTEGTVFIEFYNQVIDSTILSLNNNNVNSIYITTNATGFLGRAFCNSIQYIVSSSTYITKGQKIKIALKYSSSGLKVFVNGTSGTTNVNPISFTSTIGSIYLNDGFTLNVNQTIYNNGVQLYKTALTDTECIALTTL